MANTASGPGTHADFEAAGTEQHTAEPEGTLAAALAGGGHHPLALPVPLPLAVTLISQLASQLAARHAHGAVYGALDPRHVLLRAEPGEPPRVELADITVGVGADDAFATSGYTEPERFEGEHGMAGDQYALAALAYLLLTGEPPFAGSLAEQTFEQLFAAPEPPRRLNPSLPFAVSSVVLRALAKRPEDRYPLVVAFAAALRYAAGVAPQSAVPLPSWLRQTSAPSRPFVVTRRESVAAPASMLPPQGLAPLDEPPPTVPSPSEGTGGWRAAAPLPIPPLVPPPPQEPHSRYPLLSARARRVQIAVACALLLALLVGAGLAMAASSGQPGAGTRRLVRATATATALPTLAPTAAPTNTPTPSPMPSPTPSPTSMPIPSPTAAPVHNTSSGDAAAAGAIVVPASVAPGQQFTVRVTLINSGRTTWSSGAGYALACDTAHHSTTSCSPAFSADLGRAVVAPGRSVTFTLTLIAPAAPGEYQAWFGMVHNGRLFPSADAEVRVPVS